MSPSESWCGATVKVQNSCMDGAQPTAWTSTRREVELLGKTFKRLEGFVNHAQVRGSHGWRARIFHELGAGLRLMGYKRRTGM